MMIDSPQAEAPDVVLVPLGERAEAAAQRIIGKLRGTGIAADMAYRGNMKKRMSRASSSGATHALIIGDNELESGAGQLKNLATGEQRAVALDGLAEALKK
jgi:histidyl-tRNA synthetase